jgi:hypothetical protein
MNGIDCSWNEHNSILNLIGRNRLICNQSASYSESRLLGMFNFQNVEPNVRFFHKRSWFLSKSVCRLESHHGMALIWSQQISRLLRCRAEVGRDVQWAEDLDKQSNLSIFHNTICDFIRHPQPHSSPLRFFSLSSLNSTYHIAQGEICTAWWLAFAGRCSAAIRCPKSLRRFYLAR